MDTPTSPSSSSINERWRICTFMSFISCIILVVYLNHGCRDNITLSSLKSAAMSLTPSSYNIHPTNLSKNEKPVETYCNIFNGTWVYNPKASPAYNEMQCPFLSDQVSCQRNGRPDFEYEKWSWEANGCQIPRFNAIDMLERLKGKRMIIVGDSLNRNQWESLVCLLYSAIHPSRAHVNVRSGIYKVFTAMDYECSVEFYWSPFLVQLDSNQTNGAKVLKLDQLSTSARMWKGADIMLFNTGYWWVHSGKLKAWELFQYEGKFVDMELELAVEKGLNTWAQWVDKNVDAKKTLVFFRSISREHKEGEQWCYNKTQPMMDESYNSTFRETVIEIVEKTIGGMKTPVQYLNITKLTEYRIDAHPTIYSRKQEERSAAKQQNPESYADCSHWCLPGVPDTWNRLLYASMDLYNSRDIPASSDLSF